MSHLQTEKKTVEIIKKRLIGTTDDGVTCFYFHVAILQETRKKFRLLPVTHQ